MWRVTAGSSSTTDAASNRRIFESYENQLSSSRSSSARPAIPARSSTASTAPTPPWRSTYWSSRCVVIPLVSRGSCGGSGSGRRGTTDAPSSGRASFGAAGRPTRSPGCVTMRFSSVAHGPGVYLKPASGRKSARFARIPHEKGVREDPRLVDSVHLQAGLDAVRAGRVGRLVELGGVSLVNDRAVAVEPQPRRSRQARAQAALLGPESEPAGGRERVERHVAPALAQRGVHLLAVVLQVARGELVDQHVRAQLLEAPRVAHQAHDEPVGNALPYLVSVQPADSDHAAPARVQPVPLAAVLLRRSGREALGVGEEPQRVADRPDRLALVGHEAPHLDAGESLAVEVAPRHRLGPEALGSAREGVRGEAEPACVGDRADDLRRSHPAVVDRLLEPEREVVVAAPGRDLLAHEQQHVLVPALVAAIARLERVVVGQEDDVHARPPSRAHDLRNRPGAVRERGMEVEDAGEVVQRRGSGGHHASLIGFIEPRRGFEKEPAWQSSRARRRSESGRSTSSTRPRTPGPGAIVRRLFATPPRPSAPASRSRARSARSARSTSWPPPTRRCSPSTTCTCRTSGSSWAPTSGRRSSRTPSTWRSGARSTRSSPPTRCSGPGTCPAGWTASPRRTSFCSTATWSSAWASRSCGPPATPTGTCRSA